MKKINLLTSVSFLAGIIVLGIAAFLLLLKHFGLALKFVNFVYLGFVVGLVFYILGVLTKNEKK